MSIVTDEYVLVVGNSHVRTFAACPAFLPVFMGPGREFCFFDDATGATILDSVKELFSALGEHPPVLFVFSEPEIRFFLDSEHPGKKSDEEEFAEAVAARYARFLRQIRADWPSPIFVLGQIPRIDPVYCALATRVNARLAVVAAEEGLPYLDLWPDCIDPDTGVLRVGLDADGIHMDFLAAAMVANRLRSLNLLSSRANDRSEYRFADRHEFVLPSGRPARVWGDLKISLPSEALASTELARQLADLLIPQLEAGSSVAVVGARDGFLAFHLAQTAQFRVTAIEADDRRRGVAQRLGRLFGRLAAVHVSRLIPPDGFSALVALDGDMLPELESWLSETPRWPQVMALPAHTWEVLSAEAKAQPYVVLHRTESAPTTGAYVLARRP